jgi:hypothetical protein
MLAALLGAQSKHIAGVGFAFVLSGDGSTAVANAQRLETGPLVIIDASF